MACTSNACCGVAVKSAGLIMTNHLSSLFVGMTYEWPMRRPLSPSLTADMCCLRRARRRAWSARRRATSAASPRWPRRRCARASAAYPKSYHGGAPIERACGSWLRWNSHVRCEIMGCKPGMQHQEAYMRASMWWASSHTPSSYIEESESSERESKNERVVLVVQYVLTASACWGRLLVLWALSSVVPCRLLLPPSSLGW